MVAAPYEQPNNTTQNGGTYKTNIDNATFVMKQIAAAFAPRQSQSGSPSAPNMTVTVDAGSFVSSGTLVTQSQQVTGTIAAPTGNPRRDLVYIDQLTGAVGVATGSEAASPSDPSLPAGKIPVARVRLTVGQTEIVYADLDDLRPYCVLPSQSSVTVTAKTADFTCDSSTDGELYIIDPSSGSPEPAGAVATLPLASAVSNGFSKRFKNDTDGKSVLVRVAAGSPSDHIDGRGEIRVPAREEIEVTRTAAGRWSVSKRPTHIVGQVIEWTTNTLPEGGWAWTNGQTLSRTTYGGLFEVWGTTYGAGDGSTTFGVRDDRGRVKAGRDTMDAAAASRLTSGGSGVDGATLGAAGGAQTHTLTTPEMPAHTHPPGTYHNNVSSSSGTGAVGDSGAAGGTGPTTGSTGGGGAHNNTQPTIITNFIVKT